MNILIQPPVILDLRKTSAQHGLSLVELEAVLSDGEVALATLITEKLFIASWNRPDEAGILRKSSPSNTINNIILLSHSFGGLSPPKAI